MKSYKTWLIATLLVLTGRIAFGYNVTFDAGYHGGFQKTIVSENQDGSVTSPQAPTLISLDYEFIKWESISLPLEDDITVKAIYSKIVSVDQQSHKLLSLNLTPTNDYSSFLENLVTVQGSYVRSADGSHIRSIDNSIVNTIGDFDHSQGYLVYNASSAKIAEIVAGTSSNVFKEMSLSKGYNIIPFVSETPIAPEEYFLYILDSIEFIEDAAGKRYTSTNSTLQTLTPGEAYLVKMTEDSIFLPSFPITPDTSINPTTLSDGVTLIVTSPYDTDVIDGSTTWPHAAANGLTLREAIHFVEELSGTTPETITFSADLSTIYMLDEIRVTGASFTLDGDLNNDGIEDITITRADSGTAHRFMHTTLSNLIFSGISFENFSGTESGSVFKIIGDKGTSTANARLVFNRCTFSKNKSGGLQKGLIHVHEYDAAVDLTWSRFIKNHTEGGELIYTQLGHATLDLCLFDGNTMTIENDETGALLTTNYGSQTLTNSVLINAAGNNCYPFFIKNGNSNSGKFYDTNVTFIGFPEKNSPESNSAGTVTSVTDEFDPTGMQTTTDFGRMKFVASNPVNPNGAYIGYLRAVNEAPIINSSVEIRLVHATIKTNESTLDVTELFTDPNGDAVTLSSPVYTGSGSKPAEISYANNRFTVTPGITEGTYTYAINGTDWAGASNEATITIEVQAPLEVTAGDWERDLLNTSSSLKDAVADASINGLTFREAVALANSYPGAQAIIFNDNLVTSEIDEELIITDDLFIIGNNAAATKLQFNGAESRITIANIIEKPLSVTVSNLTFSGTLGNTDTLDDTSATPLLAIKGYRLNENVAAFATAILHSVEFVNHTTSTYGAAIQSEFAHLEMTNIYFYNLKSLTRTILNAEYSTHAIEGMTVNSCSTTPGIWKYALFTDNRNLQTAITMSNAFRSQLSSSATSSTFNNTTIGNGDAASSWSSLIGLATESDSTDSLTMSNITVAASPTTKIGYRNYLEIATNSASSSTSLPDVSQSVHNGVSRYDDDTVEAGIFADTGADEFDDSPIATTGVTINFDQQFGTGHSGSTLKTKIGEALDLAQPGDTLLFNSAEYDFAGEKLTIDKAVTISGADAGLIDTNVYGAQNVSTTFKNLSGLYVKCSNVTLTNMEISAQANVGYFTHFKHSSYNNTNTHDFYMNITVRNVIYRGGSSQVFAGNGAGVDFYNTSFFDFSRTGVLLDRRGRVNYRPKMTIKDCLFKPDPDLTYYDTRGVSFDAGNSEYPVVWDQNWTHIDHCMMDGVGLGLGSRCSRVKVTNSHIKGYSKYNDMIHIEEYSNNMIIEGNTFEHMQPARTFYIDKEGQQAFNIQIRNNTFLGEYFWIIWSFSPYNLVFENNDFTKAWAEDTTKDAFFFTSFHEGDHETLPYQLPAKDIIIRNNPGLETDVHGTLTYYELENDTSIAIEGYAPNKIIKHTVTEEPRAIIDVTKAYRIRNKVNGEYLAGTTNKTNVSLLAQEATDSTDLWTLKYNYPHTYSLKNVATGRYMEVYKGYTLADYNKTGDDIPVIPLEQKYTYSDNAVKPFFYFRDFSDQTSILFEIIPGGNEWKSRVEKVGTAVELTFAKEEVEVDGKMKKLPRAPIDASLWEFIPVN